MSIVFQVSDRERLFTILNPYIKNRINSLTRKLKKEQKYCLFCGYEKQLEAAHKTLSSKREIVYKVIDEFLMNTTQTINDLDDVIEKIIEAHMPLKEHFYFYCKDCHMMMDAEERELSTLNR